MYLVSIVGNFFHLGLARLRERHSQEWQSRKLRWKCRQFCVLDF